jgi:acyl carrier protein
MPDSENSLELELKHLIIKSLDLEDVSVDEISSDEPLFGEGLGLDSIDALELGVALRNRYGIKIEAATEEIKEHFATVANLAKFVLSAGKSQDA